MFLLYFTLRHRQRPDRLNQPLGSQNDLNRRPGAARDPQDGPKSATSVPRAPRGPPKHGFRAALAAKLGPTGTKEPPGGLPTTIFDPPRAGFGSNFVQFSSLGKHSQSCPVGKSLRKPTPSTALPPCVTSTCGLVRRRTADQEVLIIRRAVR